MEEESEMKLWQQIGGYKSLQSYILLMTAATKTASIFSPCNDDWEWTLHGVSICLLVYLAFPCAS